MIDLSVFHFVFRVDHRLEEIQSISVSFFYGFKEHKLKLNEYCVSEVFKYDYFVEYRVDIKDEEYQEICTYFMESYQKYTSYKLMGEPERLLEYPIELDSVYPDSYDSLLNELMKVDVDEQYKEKCKNIHLGVSLDNPILYQMYLENDLSTFKELYFKKVHLENHPLSNCAIEYLYVGNAYCSHLFPDCNSLGNIIKKSKSDSIKVVYVFSPMKQHEIEDRKIILDSLEEGSDVVVNDYGMLEMVKNMSFKIILGILCNKHMKDTRYRYIKGNHYVEQTGMNTDFMKEFYHSYSVQRVSYDGFKMDGNKNVDLYFPMFQMNTATMCTMYARCKNHNRAFQEEVYECPCYCLENYFLYPKHLKMIGKYNSLFGYNLSYLQDSSYLIEDCRMILAV